MSHAVVEKRHLKERIGTVVSDKMQKTIVVEVTRRVKHPKYKKYSDMKKKYYTHDGKEEAKVGDLVVISEAKPISKLKRWRLKSIIQKNKDVVNSK